MHDDGGSLVDLVDFPKLRGRFDRHRLVLEKRSIVVKGKAIWYRPIDRVRRADWDRPKLLVPELARVPRIARDESGAIPSHGLYAIFGPDDDLAVLGRMLSSGGLARLLEGRAPRVSGGYVRCYRRFLDSLPLADWA